MAETKSFADLFRQAMAAQDIGPKVTARRAQCQVGIIEYYLDGTHLPQSEKFLEKFHFLFPEESKWNEVKEAWREEKLAKVGSGVVGPADHVTQNLLSRPPGSQTAQCILELRRQYNMSQKELHRSAGLQAGKPILAYVESGDLLPSAKVFQQIYSSSLCKTDADKARFQRAYEADLLVAKDSVVR